MSKCSSWGDSVTINHQPSHRQRWCRCVQVTASPKTCCSPAPALLLRLRYSSSPWFLVCFASFLLVENETWCLKMANTLQHIRISATAQKYSTLGKETGSLTPTYCKVLLSGWPWRRVCVCPRLHPHSYIKTHTHTHSHTDASDHRGLLFCQTSDSAFLPLADNCVRGDVFFSVFSGKGSVELHSAVLKCQLKMKINNSGVEKVWAILLISTPPPDRLGAALGQSGDWRVGRLDLTAAGEVWTAGALGPSWRINNDKTRTSFCWQNSAVRY